MAVEPAPGIAPGTGDVGCYLLRLNLIKPVELIVGKVGLRQFAAGAYLYVGSAFGPGGVRARTAHHLRITDRPHWHVDYLRQVMPIDEIWFAESSLRLEHQWADFAAAMAGCKPVSPGLGASDCGCATHLFYFAQAPKFKAFNGLVESSLQSPLGYKMQRWRNPAQTPGTRSTAPD